MLSDNFLSEPDILLNQLDDILAQLKKMGADSAEATISENISFDTQCRLGKMIDMELAEQRDLSLRAFIGKRKADINVSFLGLDNITELTERIIAMAQAAPEDPYCGLAEKTAQPNEIKEIEIYDKTIPDINVLRTNTKEAETAALALAGITNSEGAIAGWQVSQTAHLTSAGFRATEKETNYHLSCAVLAEKNGEMERDYEFSATHFVEDMPTPKMIGDIAAKRTLERCGARKLKSCVAAVIYDPRIARSLLGHFAAAISGAAIARGTSFLKNEMEKQIFNENITITDDPFRCRGLRSQAFDGEGVLGAKQNFIENGKLQNWFLDSPAARQLGLKSTGHSGGATNLFLQSANPITPQEMMAQIGTGFYVTELIGMGVNMVTGDYSRGASGFWVENGELAFPVNEITIVGNLKQMFKVLSAADDLKFRYGVDTPTLCVEQMTIAGA